MVSPSAKSTTQEKRKTRFRMPPVATHGPSLDIHADDRPRRPSVTAKELKGWLISASIHMLVLLILMVAVISGIPQGAALVIQLSTRHDAPRELALISPAPSQAAPASVDPDVVMDLMNEHTELPNVLSIVTPGHNGSSMQNPVDNTEDQNGDNKIPSNEAGTVASFFGATATGNRFVYVLDISGSMNRRGGRRFARARDELLRSIRELKPTQEFYVLLYSSSTILMTNESKNQGFRFATADQKETTENWLKRVRPKGGTEPQDALAIAGTMKPDAVFFLSDGDFPYTKEEFEAKNGKANYRKLAEQIEKLKENGIAKRYRLKLEAQLEELQATGDGSPESVIASYAEATHIHSISFENKNKDQNMEEIASRTGGSHHFIAAPEEEPKVLTNAPLRRAPFK